MAPTNLVAFARTQPPKNELDASLCSNIRSNIRLILHGDEFCAVCFQLEDLVVLNEVSSVNSNVDIMMGCCVENMLIYLFGDHIQEQLVSSFICGKCINEIKQAFALFYKVNNGRVILEKCIEHLSKQVNSSKLNSRKDAKANGFNNLKKYQCESTDFVLCTSTDSNDEINDSGRVITCKTCHKTFSSESAITQHIVHSHISPTPHCDQCNEKPCVHEKYLLAVRSQMKTGGVMKCVDCDYNCMNLCSLLSHTNRVHLHFLPYMCDSCSQCFPCKKTLQFHIKKYHNTVTKCLYCDKQFIKPILEKHEVLCKSIKRRHRCLKCPASFDNQPDLAKHKKQHKKPILCTLCFKGVKSEYSLKRHMFYAHNGPKPDIKEVKKLVRLCSICPALLSSAKELKEHLQSHGPNEKHKCQICNREFNSRKLYNIHCSSYQHLLKVNPSRTFNFKCDKCDFSAMSKLKMEYHKNAKHLRVKPYKCDICSKELSTELGLKYHKDSHEGIKGFQCSICTNLFTSLSGLKKHILRLHSDKKPVQCSQCDKSFVCQSEYNIHKLRSHSEKSVSCPMCPSKFSTLSNLRGHVRKIHFKGLPFDKILSQSNVSEEVQEMIRDHRLPF